MRLVTAKEGLPIGVTGEQLGCRAWWCGHGPRSKIDSLPAPPHMAMKKPEPSGSGDNRKLNIRDIVRTTILAQN